MTKMSERLRFHGRFGDENGLEQATRKYGEREKAACLLDDAENALVQVLGCDLDPVTALHTRVTLARIRGEQ